MMILKMIKTVMMISSQAMTMMMKMSGKNSAGSEWAICSSHVDQLPIAEQSLLLHHFASGRDDDQDGADDGDQEGADNDDQDGAADDGQDGADDIDNNIHL